MAELDALHGTLSGPATKKLCERAFVLFGDTRYQRLARISNGHLYHLRQTALYRRQRVRSTKTRPVKIAIGERRKPRPQGQPGYLRIDSVHQGDLDGIKGGGCISSTPWTKSRSLEVDSTTTPTSSAS